MFAKITEFKKNGKKLRYVNERFEYFHHYWTLIFLTKIKKPPFHILLKPNYLFLEKDKLESHRSLFIKINKQLEHNYKNAYDKINYLFINNSLFNQDNVLIRDKPELLKNRDALFSLIVSHPHGDKRGRIYFNKNESDIRKRFEKLEKQILHVYPYEKSLAYKLFKILSVNKPLSRQDKKDIKFLVNAFIVELYQYGYSEKYIERIPNIIILRDNRENFPHSKKQVDFKDRESYRQYILEENKKLNSKTMLAGLPELLNVPKHKGYVIFKIDGITIDESIELLDVVFYNPQKDRKVVQRDEFLGDPELFFVSKESSSNCSLSMQASACNAYVETPLISPSDRNVSRAKIEAYRKVERSSILLSDILNRYVETSKRIEIYPQLKKNIIIFDSTRTPGYDSKIFDNLSNSPTEIKPLEGDSKYWMDKEIDFLNSANYTSYVGRRIIALIHQHKRLENDSSSFNFRDLWIAWEAMFEKTPKKKQESFKTVAFNAIKIFLSRNFFPKIKEFLRNDLQHRYDQNNYFLQSREMNNLGLAKEKGKYVRAGKFKNKYQNILGHIDFPLLQEIIATVNTFEKDSQQYYTMVDEWIKKTIDEVYAERNLEVHNNEETDLSRFKLQGDFLEISSITMHEILRNINRNTEGDIQKVFERIERKAAKI